MERAVFDRKRDREVALAGLANPLRGTDQELTDQLETILRHVADELALWRARAVKAEAVGAKRQGADDNG